MRIALVTYSVLPAQGGAEHVVHDLASQWTAMGHEVRVMNGMTRKVMSPHAGYTAARFWIPRGATRVGYHRQPWLCAASWSLSRLLKAFKPDIVSGHCAIPTAFYLSARCLWAPWTITAHGSDVVMGSAGSVVDRYGCHEELAASLRQATALVAISEMAEKALERYSVTPAAVYRITNGVDLDTFSRPVAEDMRSRLGLPAHSEFLLTVARNNPVKNLSLGLRAFAEWERRPPYLYYVIVGKGAEALASEAAKLGIREKVVPMDGLPRHYLIAAYQQAIVYISTSRRECCPLVILEAMAAGLPQVATRVMGNTELVVDNETGFLSPDNEPGSMRAAIEKLVMSRDLRCRLAQKGSKRAKLYDLRHTANQYLAMFSSCLHRLREGNEHHQPCSHAQALEV